MENEFTIIISNYNYNPMARNCCNLPKFFDDANFKVANEELKA